MWLIALIFSYLFPVPLNIIVIKIPNRTLFWVMPNFTTLTQTIFLPISSVKLSSNTNHLHCALTSKQDKSRLECHGT